MTRLARFFILVSASAAVLAIFFAAPARAQIYAELNVFYLSDTLNTGSAVVSTRMFIDTSLGFQVDKGGRFLAGWGYSMHSTSHATTTTTTYSSTQMGPRFVYHIDRNKNWSVGAGYYLVTSATYNSGSGDGEKWKGTAIKADFGHNFNLTNEFLLGLRLNYSSASYVEKLVGTETYSTVSYTKVMMYPSVYMIYLF